VQKRQICGDRKKMRGCLGCEITANGHGVSLEDDENILDLLLLRAKFLNCDKPL
jgi:hypothetical protein